MRYWKIWKAAWRTYGRLTTESRETVN